MPRYTVASPKGVVLSDNHRTPLGAIRKARQHAIEYDRDLTVSEFANKHAKTGRPIAKIGFTGEWDAKGHPLQFWNDGSPVI